MEGFVSKNTGIKIDHVYKSNDVKDYIRTINIMEIEPGETIRLVFSTPPTTLANLFYNMTKIKSVDLSHFNTTELTDMSHLFDGCTELEAITFGNSFNKTKVANMSHLFYNCISLISINLSKLNTESVTKMSYLFAYCSGLTEINLNTFNTENVEKMEGMFMKCEKLTSLNLAKFKTPSLKKMTLMFSGCSSLLALDISNFNLTKTSDELVRGAAFDGLTNLKYLNLLNITLGNLDFSKTDLDHQASLVVCSQEGTKPFSNESSKIFKCCETPFNTNKCSGNGYIIVEYGENFEDNLIGFNTKNSEINNALIYLDDETDNVPDILNFEIKPGSKLKIEFI